MSTLRPRIGIAPSYRVKEVHQNIPRVDIQTNYTNAVTIAGGLPVVLVPNPNDGHAEAYADMIDGLLLTGGPDIDPALFKQEPHVETRTLAPERQTFDMALLRAMIERKKPVLGICLGHQEINVALGGSLHQHLPDAIQPYEIEHRWVDRENTPLPRHDVDVESNTRLAKILGEGRVSTNSSHHQGIDRVAKGMRVSARTPDGVIEALESDDGETLLSVQWHPEYLTDEAPHRGLFEDLVERANRKRG
jgi:putative glutamine amidotransferase